MAIMHPTLESYSFEEFLGELDSFEEFMFMSDLDRLQTETEADLEEVNQFGAFWSDLIPFNTDIDNILAGLPAVETATLPEGERTYPICMDEYHDDIPSATVATCLNKITDDDTSAGTATISSAKTLETEPAIRLRCNHVLGRTCLASWLTSGTLTCPFCRADVRAPQRVVDTFDL
ncbi:hypothetical protein MMC07_004047 [Pseudocyphellaria aurata]|nr:hypothetical protein [Pseudocyphellaria aurata]